MRLYTQPLHDCRGSETAGAILGRSDEKSDLDGGYFLSAPGSRIRLVKAFSSDATQ